MLFSVLRETPVNSHLLLMPLKTFQMVTFLSRICCLPITAG